LADAAAAGRSAATLTRRAAALAYFHGQAGYPSPTRDRRVKEVLAGIRRSLGTAPTRKAAATASHLAAMVATCDLTTRIGLRDRALLVIGFAGAFRRAELVALTVADLSAVPAGLTLRLRRSKTDPEGQGRTVAIPAGTRLRPVHALTDWLTAAGITAGPLFRPVRRGGVVGATALTDKAVARIVKQRAALAGFDPAGFSGHSLRAGFVTSAAQAGARTDKIMAVTGHTAAATVQRYVRDAEAFVDHAGAAFL
jgi:integrase